MKTKMKVRIARAKRTALGRLFCRLAGDNAGAVMMEYVVLGVLVVAAVVGLVVAFGDTIGSAFKTMSTAIFNPGDAPASVEEGRNDRDTAVSTGENNQRSVTGMGQ